MKKSIFVVIDEDKHRDDFIWAFSDCDEAIRFAQKRYIEACERDEVTEESIKEQNKYFLNQDEPNYYGFIHLDKLDTYMGYISRWVIRAEWSENNCAILVREIPLK
jgi:hypothetical protein